MSAGALLWRQFRFERRMFWRNPSAAFFNFTLPFLFLIMIASVFGADSKEMNILIPGIAGLLGSAVTNAFAQVGLIVLIGHLAYGVGWPRDWLALVGFTALGVTCFGALGVAFSHAIPNLDAAPAYSNAVFLPVIFISGVFYSTDSLPRALDALAQALPLKHVIDGLSAAVVGGSVDELGAAVVVGVWALGGLALAVRYFRWE